MTQKVMDPIKERKKEDNKYHWQGCDTRLIDNEHYNILLPNQKQIKIVESPPS